LVLFFLFSPVFEASDVEELGDVCPVLENVDDATLLYAPDVSGRALALHSRTELVDGFYSPNKALQTFLSLRFGVNASPYTGEESTSLKYYGGGELFKRALTKLERAPSRALNLKLREVEKLMAKVSVYKECKSGGEAPDVAKLKSSMCDPMVHVAIPTQGNLLSFGGYLQQQMQASARTGDRFQICVGVLVDATSSLPPRVCTTPSTASFSTPERSPGLSLLRYWRGTMLSRSTTRMLVSYCLRWKLCEDVNCS